MNFSRGFLKSFQDSILSIITSKQTIKRDTKRFCCRCNLLNPEKWDDDTKYSSLTKTVFTADLREFSFISFTARSGNAMITYDNDSDSFSFRVVEHEVHAYRYSETKQRNFFVRLHPKVVQEIYLLTKQNLLSRHRTLPRLPPGENGWVFSQDLQSKVCQSGIEFLPLAITQQIDNVDVKSGEKTFYTSYNGGDLFCDGKLMRLNLTTIALSSMIESVTLSLPLKIQMWNLRYCCLPTETYHTNVLFLNVYHVIVN
jgi:hypothetical protein